MESLAGLGLGVTFLVIGLWGRRIRDDMREQRQRSVDVRDWERYELRGQTVRVWLSLLLAAFFLVMAIIRL